MPGADYEYLVVAARRTDGGWIEGAAGSPSPITAVDTSPPRRPMGLASVESDSGAFLTWNTNTEADLAGYRLYKRESPAVEFRPVPDETLLTNAFFDPEYRPGVQYAVSAIDESGNESTMSLPMEVP